MATFSRVTAVLILSTALLNYAQGSVSSHDDNQVFPGFDFAAVHGQFEKIRAQTLRPKDAPRASAGTAATTVGQPGVDQASPDITTVRLTLLSEMAQRSALNINNNSRNLQEADCSDGATPLLVTSTVFPRMEGCLSPSVVDGTLEYTTGTAFIVYVERSDPADPPIWGAYYADASDEFIVACFSSDNADLVDPSEAAWICDTDGDGEGFVLADAELSVSCGCSIASPSPMATAAPAPSTTVSACGEGDSFSIVSEAFPVTEGCYLDTGFVLNDQVIYTPSGTEDAGQVWMATIELSGDATSSTAGDIVWVLLNVAASGEPEDNDLYCLSSVGAPFYHPSEVPSWTCIEGATIDVACGCSGSPSPTPPSPVPSPISPRTPAPVTQPMSQPTAEPASITAPSPASGTIANACPGDGSFTITSNANPELSGCFIGSTTIDGLAFVYTVSGTTSLSEIVIFAVETDDGDFDWSIAFIELSDNDESQLYCTSAEPASDVNPGDASWICDFSGNNANLLLATEEDISIVCGSCGTFVGTPQPTASEVPAPTPSPVSQRAPTPVSTPTTPTTAEPIRTLAPSPASVGGFPLVPDTCSGDGSFTITANAAPNLDGCYKDTFEVLQEGSMLLYSRSGEATEPEVIVFSFADDFGDFKWYIGFLDLGEGNKSSRAFCVSVQSASDVNPGNASWICDFTGNSETFLLSSEEDMAIACGSCTEVAPDGASQDASPASKLRVGVITAGGAGMVSVASEFASWW